LFVKGREKKDNIQDNRLQTR